MILQLLTMVYGSKHVELFKEACLASLSTPRNRKAINEHGAKWSVYTDEDHIHILRKLLGESFPSLKIDFVLTEDLRRYTDPIQSAIIKQIESCLHEGHRLLICPPDTIFAEGTIANLIAIGREPGSVVVVPHPRILPSILNEGMLFASLSPARMVDLCFKHLHQSWTDAEIGHVRQNSFVGGVKWQRLDKLIVGSHYLPTPYLMDFTEEDLSYFKTQISFGSFDHVWANDVLLKLGRQRYVASSDACFIAEITEEEKNVPPIWDGDPDSFWRNNMQFDHDKQTVFTFRGEE